MLFRSEEAGVQVPKTWDELQETALKLTKEDRYGFAMPALRSEESVFSFLPLLWGYGGKIAEIESEESQAAFLKLRELSESGAMSPSKQPDKWRYWKTVYGRKCGYGFSLICFTANNSKRKAKNEIYNDHSAGR